MRSANRAKVARCWLDARRSLTQRVNFGILDSAGARNWPPFPGAVEVPGRRGPSFRLPSRRRRLAGPHEKVGPKSVPGHPGDLPISLPRGEPCQVGGGVWDGRIWSGRQDSDLRQPGSRPGTLARLSYTLMKPGAPSGLEPERTMRVTPSRTASVAYSHASTTKATAGPTRIRRSRV